MGQEPPPSEGRKRTMGDALGGWARRVGALIGEATGQVVLPDGLREVVDEARGLRLGGHPDQALVLLRGLADPLSEHPAARFSVGLCHVHDGLHGGRPIRALTEASEQVGDSLGSGPLQLLRAAASIFDSRWEAGLDELRRAGRDYGRLVDGDAGEVRFLVHLLGSIAQFALGHEDRTLRELQKARARLPLEAGEYLRTLILVRGVDHLLAAGMVEEAELWVREAQQRDPAHGDAGELELRVRASKGDRAGAHAAMQSLAEVTFRTRLWVGLTVGLPAGAGELRDVAMAVLREDPEDLARRRLWALAELKWLADHPDAQADDLLRNEILGALAGACGSTAKTTRDRQLQELAHAALRLDCFPEDVRRLVMARLIRDEGTAAEELRLVRARTRLERGEIEAAEGDFVMGNPPTFRGDPDIGGPWGPDPMSPMRNQDVRTAVLGAQRALVAAELSMARNDVAAAQDLLVAALVEWPGLGRAREMLGKLAPVSAGGRLEELLTAATGLLAGVPNRVLGVQFDGVGQALSQVVAARERLARPLTIAIMGEFSAGKSTFVNALLGEAVAPMGVLPTTTTINVFRRGPGGNARVHYRDGHFELLPAASVHGFLEGLDSVAAAAIRHVEIERTGARMGDAAVVDTPGLNALDPFHEQVAREFVEEADAVVWLFSATRSGAASEAGMLASLRAGGRQVLGVLNKVDTLDAGETEELQAYLREQLGEVLVEVVSLRARDALEHRVGRHRGEDPFLAVEEALERHFLQRARELKRGLTQRRLGEALAAAREQVQRGVDELERRAAVVAGGKTGSESVSGLLDHFAIDLAGGVLELDDLLVREGLALGLLRTGKGTVSGELDPQDLAYLTGCFREGALAVLQRALVQLAHRDPLACEAVDAVFVPWAQGHLAGLLAGGFIEVAFAERGKRIAQGEAAGREAFRAALVPVADAWATRARELVHTVEKVRSRAQRRAASAPRAEALRLRAAVLTPLEALMAAVQGLDACG